MKNRSPVTTAIKRDALPAGRIALFLFVSGVIALVYEVIWQRQFALVFGSAAPATAAVLAAYFAGLGLGAWLLGAHAKRWTRPLRTYALLELMIGLGALASGPLLAAFERVYPWVFQSISNQPSLFLAARIVAAFLILAVPTVCMGGTLPLLGPMMDQGQKHLGLTAGWLYVVNTAGAALGALAVPFIFLPQLGLRHTVWAGAGVNLILAASAWRLDHLTAEYAPLPTTSSKKARQTAPDIKPSPFSHRAVQLLALTSGAVTFALQVLWNRAFAQIHENSMYSFAVIVAVTITGLAIGGQIARIGLRQGRAPKRLIAGSWILAGIFMIASPWLFLHFSNQLAYLTSGEGWFDQVRPLLALAGGFLLVPMALLGVGFPSIMELSGRTGADDSARALGQLFTVNVIGSVVGSLLSGFLLPYWLGMWDSLIWLGALLVLVGLCQAIDRVGRKSGTIVVCLALVLWLGLAVPLARLNLDRVSVESAASEHLVSLAEGAHGIVAVVERPGSRRLKLNNHYGLGGTASTGDERMQAHIPLLLHPAPRRVAFLGLGTGITAGGASFHPVENVSLMELVPEVVTAARVYFRRANGGIIDDPRTLVIADDARHALRSGNAQYDVIISDLVVPWRQGEGSLFTLEQVSAARHALAPGGLYCQWLPLFQLSETELNIIIRTFLTVFPHAQIWRGDFSPTEPAIALIGSLGDPALNADLVRRRLSELKPDPANPQLQSPENFWMNYIGRIDSSQLPPDDLRLNLDDRPWVEMLGPMLHTGGTQGNIFTGRRLQAWLKGVGLRSQSEISALPVAEASAVQAGRALAEMTLCLSEGDQPGAKNAQAQVRELLPAAAFRQLF